MNVHGDIYIYNQCQRGINPQHMGCDGHLAELHRNVTGPPGFIDDG